MIRVRLERGYSFNGLQMWIMEDRGDRCFMAQPTEIVFKEVSPSALLPQATFSIRNDLAHDLIPELKKALAGYTFFDDKEDLEASKRLEKAMQAHIDSLKMIVDRTVK